MTDLSFDDLHRATQSSMRFHLETEKGHAVRRATILADYLAGIGTSVGYMGPLAIAGGWVRDLALHRHPKDLDVFIDGGSLTRMDEAEKLADALAGYLGHGFLRTRMLPSYGTWAPDLAKVVKIEQGMGEEPLWLRKDMPIPGFIDLIVLDRKELELGGYRPAAHPGNGTRASFLAAVLARVDLRLNAIGATPTGSDWAHAWSDDALHQRLVVQAARLNEGELISTRILTRIARQREAGAKYEGWNVHRELPDGSLQDA